jgi:transcription antitermination factor NusG
MPGAGTGSATGMSDSEPSSPDLPPWAVVHTLARCEKQVVRWAEREGIPAELPVYGTFHRYRGKTVRFEKPLFPGYVFLRVARAGHGKVAQNRHVARVLVPPDPEEFDRQLGDILVAVAAGLEIRPAPGVVAGVRVNIVSGPLRGLEGVVERRDEPMDVVLRLDFIGQAAAVRMLATDVEVM